MQSLLSKFVSFNKGVRNSMLIGFVIFGTFALFAQLTSPYDIKVINPEAKVIERQKELGHMFDTYKPKDAMDKSLLEGSQKVYCGLIGITCDKNYDVFSLEHYDKSLIGQVGGLLATPFTNPPASGTYYVFHSLDQAGFIPDTYAAEGLGFAGLAPFINIWKKLRDIAFLVIALAMILSGFMIMFRTKMDPQHAIKLENALPKIILTLILINFSFAIAGFMIDLMYIMTGLIIVTFGPLISPDLSIGVMLDRYLSPGPTDLLHLGVGNYSGTIVGLLNSLWNVLINLPKALLGIFGTTIRSGILLIAGSVIFSFLGFKWIGFLTQQGQVYPVAGGIVGLIVVLITLPILAVLSYTLLPYFILGLIILFTVVYVMVQILIITFKTYIKLLFYIMLSPLILIMEALPGSNVFIPWLQTIFVELLTFPMIIGIFLLSGAFNNAISNGRLLKLPFVLTSINPEVLGTIVSFGILFMMPDFIQTAKEKLQTESMSVPAINPAVFFKGLATPAGAIVAKPRGLIIASDTFKPLGRLVERIPFLKALTKSASAH